MEDSMYRVGGENRQFSAGRGGLLYGVTRRDRLAESQLRGANADNFFYFPFRLVQNYAVRQSEQTRRIPLR